MTGIHDDYASLAELFTTTDEAPAADGGTIELLIPGHLPVQGGLWLVPYAVREAGDGMAVLLRMREDSIDIALVGRGAVSLVDCRTIEDVRSAIGDRASLWIVQPMAAAGPSELSSCGAGRVTLLSGADQAAVVGAYRVLKDMASGGQVSAPIRLVIVGAEDRSSSDAASRIVQTARHQLSVDIETGPPLPAMGSGGEVVAEVTLPWSDSVKTLFDHLRCEAVEPAKVLLEEDSVPTQAQPVEVTMAASPAASLSSHVPGLVAMAVRCPDHEEVELALDGDGGLHVLANADDLRAASIVFAWIERHRELIAMACGAVQLAAEREPMRHLFTSDAASVADLQGSGIRLHLLTEVEVDGHRGPFCTPLN